MINQRYERQNNQKRQLNQNHPSHSQTQKHTFYNRPKVQDKENHNYETYENQMSNLEKIAQAKHKISHSKVSEDYQDYHYNNPITNVMKFSFNKDYAQQTNDDWKLKNLDNDASGYQNYSTSRKLIRQYDQQYFDQTEENPQIHQFSISSIKGKGNDTKDLAGNTNQQGAIKSKRWSQREQDSQMNRLDNLASKLNSMFLKDKYKNTMELENKYNKPNEDKKEKFSNNSYSHLNKKKQIAEEYNRNYEDKVSTTPTLTHKESYSSVEDQIYSRTHYIQFLFDRLNHKKQDRLTKNNCQIALISDELKILFGIVFTRIFIQNKQTNKIEFVKECLEAIKQFQPNELIHQLLKQLDPPKKDNYQHHAKYNSDIKQREKQKQKIKTLNSNVYKLEASPQIYSFNRAVDTKFGQFKLNPSNSHHQKYNQEAQIQQNTSHRSFFQNYKSTPMNSQQYTKKYNSQLFADMHHTKKKEKTASFVQLPITSTQPVKNKIRNISAEMIRQHKRNLSHLFRINEKIQYYIEDNLFPLEDSHINLQRRLQDL